MDNLYRIQKSLEKVLGVKFKPVPTVDDTYLDEEKKAFIKVVKHLEKLMANEDSIYEKSKIDITTIVEPYWAMIEELLVFYFSNTVAEIIWWYIYDRKLDGGKIQPWVDEDGTAYTFKNPGDLYEYIMFKYGM